MSESKARRGSTRPRRKGRKRQVVKIIGALLAIPAIVVLAFLIHYYFLFNAAIEQKLGNRVSVSAMEIYAAPTVLYPGKRLGQAALQVKVRRLGYEDSSAVTDPSMATYDVSRPKHMRIHNDVSFPEDSDITADVTFSGEMISSIVDERRGAELEKFSLKPQMLSTAINKNREKRRFVPYQDIPKVLIDAVLAAEDRRFFQHRGIDPIRILKALLIDLREGDKVQGASTLTQQFVKNYFLTPERTWRRKFADGYMSILLEQRLSKEQIFELYANEVYLGQLGSFSIIGFGEAADAFFDKNLKDLTLGEAAVLAGIITAPNRHAPLRYPDRAAARRNLVLNAMAEYELISPNERDEAKSEALDFKSSVMLNYSDAPYFVDYVQDLLVDAYGEMALAQSQYKVYTSLDLEMQQAAFESVRKGITELDAYFAGPKLRIPPGTVQASLIAVDPRSGQVLAMVGGRNYGASQYNRITQSKRQPGSIFKPFVYAAALESAYYSPSPLTAVSTVLDGPSQFTFEKLLYEPRNFKDEYLGQVTMRQAITKSLNVATIKFAEKVGYLKITDLAHRLGLNEQIKPYPAMAIGSFEVTPLEMVRAYTAFSNKGLLSNLTPIAKIRDTHLNTVLATEPRSEQVLTPQIAFLVTSLLQSVMNEGTGAGVRTQGFTLPAAGKTGTSRDGWFAGYTPDLLCIVWVGFDDNRELNLSGSQSALPIWADFMKKIVAERPLSGEDFVAPDGITQVEIDPTTGLLATERCLERHPEYFVKGTEPALRCFGNNYEQSANGLPVSIYATPAKDSGDGTDNMKGTSENGKKPAGY